ncbi:hypothetical protein LSUE1_G005877 [Lachnellula suecica]|uniref:RBR-type E3 ubiquitin transferase n=1 Tax=Lachnellula suecica TaxID=602035 RepID=A0A8T9C2U0_9HELO|nr:hypothetical protein LSUE1_G005877 [Lachnellula suecica]
MEQQNLNFFLRDADPATAVLIAQIRIPELENELAIQTAMRGANDRRGRDGERRAREELEGLRRVIATLGAQVEEHTLDDIEVMDYNPRNSIAQNRSFRVDTIQTGELMGNESVDVMENAEYNSSLLLETDTSDVESPTESEDPFADDIEDFADDWNSLVQVNPKTVQADPAPVALLDGKPCTVCQELFDERVLAIAPCEHAYCLFCIQDFFTRSFTDEALFPPKCCQQPILPESVKNYLTKKIRTTFVEKQIEFSTVNRTYCANTKCGAFIVAPKSPKKWLCCTKCKAMTCAACKSGMHAKGECAESPDTKKFKQLASKEGWQECPTCGRTVDLMHGCHHITLVSSPKLREEYVC